MKAKDLDKKFDDGEDIVLKQRRVSVDFPEWMIESLDKEARRLGVPRQSIIKIRISERLKELS